jgi:hypothetical protein
MPPSPSPRGDIGGEGRSFNSGGSANDDGQVAGQAAAALHADVQLAVAAGAAAGKVAAPPGVTGNSIPKDIVAVRRNGRHVCYNT